MGLTVDNLRTSFRTAEGTLYAVDGVSFSVAPGKTLCLVGESGCGKSVTALSLMRLLPERVARIESGSVRLAGRELLTLDEEEMRQVRGNELAIIFQEPMTSLNPVLTVGRQIAEAIEAHQPKLGRAATHARVRELLTQVGISEPERRYRDFPHQMSGGMRQRIMIAMALSCRPKVLIADEPTTALDVTIQAQILALLNSLKAQYGMGIILVTHDLGVVAETADDVVVMYAGQVIEQSGARELFENPRHPYTRGLIQSLPKFEGAADSARERLRGIPGSVPPLTQLPPGCRFQDRCSLVTARCRADVPPLRQISPGRLVRCGEVN